MCRCWLGHNAATVTRPNCFGVYFFRLKRFSKIQLAVFPEAKLFSGRIFRVKNEIQNLISEFASRYGMVGRVATHSVSVRVAPPAPARRPAGLGRPATGHRPRPPVAARVAGSAARPRVAGCGHGHRTRTDTDERGHGKPATVKTWRSAGRVAAGFKQKSRQPAKGSRQGKTAGA